MNAPLEIKCIIKPINPFTPNKEDCTIATINSVIRPAGNPNNNVPIVIGISAISYSRNGAAGIRGILIKHTSTIDIAASSESWTK